MQKKLKKKTETCISANNPRGSPSVRSPTIAITSDWSSLTTDTISEMSSLPTYTHLKIPSCDKITV